MSDEVGKEKKLTGKAVCGVVYCTLTYTTFCIAGYNNIKYLLCQSYLLAKAFFARPIS